MNGWPDPDFSLLEEGADDVLLGLLARDNEPPPPPWRGYRQAQPPPAVDRFDRAAFIRHMHELIAHRRDAAKQRVFAREREVLDELLEGEGLTPAGKVAFQPPPPPKPVQVVYSPPPPKPKPAPVEPWFDRSRVPTLEDMKYLTNYTLGYFVAAYRPGEYGLEHVGEQSVCIVCARDADAIAGAMKRFSDELSRSVHLSAKPEPVPKDVLGVSVVSPYVAMRVVSHHGGQNVSIEVTWDDDRQAA